MTGRTDEQPDVRTARPAIIGTPSEGWILIPIQVFVTGLVTFVVVAAYADIAVGYDGGLQVVGYALASALLTFSALVLGLPLRIVPLLRRWWVGHSRSMVVLFLTASGFLVLSYVVGDAGPVHYPATEFEHAVSGYAPDALVFWTAAGAVAFATMHLRPPRRSRRS